ncbi:MAG: hypothetical protein AAF481_20260 [Acidobacteriota bacterium]
MAYSDADSDGRSDERTGQSWGGDPLSIAYDTATRTATVTDRRGESWTTVHDAAGHATRRTDPSGASWDTTYDDESLITEERSPLGRVVATTFDTTGDRRGRGDALTVIVTADSRGANGSSPSQSTQYEYHSRTHRPVRITDPRGTVTEIERAASGRPERITRAAGLPEQAIIQITWDDFGRQ